jgi:hypothetical protein
VLSAAVVLGLLGPALGAPAASAGTGDVERVSVASNGAQGDGDSIAPSISQTGRSVAFQSFASTLGWLTGTQPLCRRGRKATWLTVVRAAR